MSLHSELEYCDLCTVRVRAVTYPSELPIEVFEIDISPNEEGSAGDVLDVVDEVLRGPVNFAVEHRRSYVSWGASSGQHELLVDVGVSIAGNLIFRLLELAHAKVTNGGQSEHRLYSDEGGIVDTARGAVLRAFDSRLSLSLEKVSVGTDSAECWFIDTFGAQYTVKLDLISGTKHMLRIPRSE